MHALRPAILDIRTRAENNCIPLHAQLEVTHRCNLRCQHCYLRETPTRREEELTFSEIESALEQLKTMGTFFLTITGGECTLRDDLPEILQAARERNFLTCVLTNGTLITESRARAIAATQPFQVHVSLLGPESVHDNLTGKTGSFRSAVDAMKRFRDCGIQTVCKAVLTKPALPFAAEVRAFAKTIADEVRLSVEILPTLEGTPPSAALANSLEDLKQLPPPDKLYSECPAPPGPDEPLCAAGRSLLTISPYGDVFPCLGFRMSGGTIRGKNLRTIWESKAFEQVRNLKRDDLPGCDSCPDVAFCSYCPGQAYQETGDFAHPTETICQRARRTRALWNLASTSGPQ